MVLFFFFQFQFRFRLQIGQRHNHYWNLKEDKWRIERVLHHAIWWENSLQPLPDVFECTVKHWNF